MIAMLGAVALPAADNPWSWTEYRKAVISPSSVGKQLFTAGLAQWRDSPPEWGQGMEGYGKRIGSRVATHAVQGTFRYSVAHWRGEDIKYHPSELGGKWDRVMYAVKRTFVVPRTDGLGTTVSIANFAGAYGGATVSAFWHPADRRTPRAVLFTGTLSLGYQAAGNIVREFWRHKNKTGQTKDRKR